MRSRTPPKRDRSGELLAASRVVRDFSITGVAVFLFIYGALNVRDVAVLAIIFGAAGSLLGLPPFLRRNQWNGDE